MHSSSNVKKRNRASISQERILQILYAEFPFSKGEGHLCLSKNDCSVKYNKMKDELGYFDGSKLFAPIAELLDVEIDQVEYIVVDALTWHLPAALGCGRLNVRQQCCHCCVSNFTYMLCDYSLFSGGA